MNIKTLLFVLAMIVALSVWALLSMQNAETVQMTPDTISVTTTSGIGFTYASTTYALATSPEQILVNAYIPPCDEGFDYCAYRIGGAYQGTNFESAGIRIKNRTELSTKEKCVSTAPEGYVDFHSVVSEHGDYTTTAFGPLGDAGAGHYAAGELYRLWSGAGCEEFETHIGETHFANYPAGSIRLFSDSDRAHVQSELRAIIDSLMFKGEKISFPAVPTDASQGAQ